MKRVSSIGLRGGLHLVRGAVPAVLVATVVPLAAFYGFSALFDLKAGIIASLVWAYAMLAWQAAKSRRLSGLLILTAFTLTVRGVAWGVHQSAFTYFIVPVIQTVGMAALFVVTLAIGRPLLVSLARDFVPSLGDHLTDRHHQPLVRHLSCVWGVVYLGSAVTSAILLETLNVKWFLLLHQASGWIWTGSGLAVSVIYGQRRGKELLAIALAGLNHRPSLATASA